MPTTARFLSIRQVPELHWPSKLHALPSIPLPAMTAQSPPTLPRSKSQQLALASRPAQALTLFAVLPMPLALRLARQLRVCRLSQVASSPYLLKTPLPPLHASNLAQLAFTNAAQASSGVVLVPLLAVSVAQLHRPTQQIVKIKRFMVFLLPGQRTLPWLDTRARLKSNSRPNRLAPARLPMHHRRMFDEEKRQKPRAPKPMTRSLLRQLAENYVGRFGGPSSNLRRVLLRHAQKDGTDGKAWLPEIEAIIADFLQTGALDDAKYAEHAARVLTGRGMAPRMVQFRLRQKGIQSADVDHALQELGDPRQAEREAALKYAKRRRLGPFRPQEQRKEKRQKDAAAMARAGFAMGVIFKILDAKSPEDMDDF